MLRYLLPLIVALVAAGTAAAQVDPLTLSSPIQRAELAVLPPSLSGVAAALTSNEQAWQAMRSAQAVRLLEVPLSPTKSATLNLIRVEPFTADAVIVEVVDGPGGKPIERVLPRPEGEFFSGSIEGAPDSRVMLSHSAAGVHGYAQDSTGVYVLSSGPPTTNQPILCYRLSDLPEGAITWHTFPCDAREGGKVFMNASEGGVAGEMPCRQVKVAVETDYEFTGLFGGNTTASAAYAGTIFAGVLDIYKRDLNVLTQVSYLRVWATAADPWTASNSGSQLDEFQGYWLANMTTVVRNTAQFLSGRSLGGGVAYLSSLCNNAAFGVEGNLGGYFPYPVLDNNGQNWDLMVVVHEMGHNFGAPHTHNYCPPADSCAPSGYFGSCQTQQVCINTGTIMSYCHLCSGGMANMQMRFHDQSIQSISNYLSGGGACNMLGTSVPPVGVYDYLTVPRGIVTDLDVIANELQINCEAVTISSYGAVTAEGGSAELITGGGPGGRDVIRYLSPPGFTGQDIVWYRLTDTSQQQSQLIFAYLDVQALRYPDNPIGDSPALDANYYVLSSPQVVPNFTALTPYLTTTVPQINYASTNGNFANSNRPDNVGARWTGWVNVDQPGFYTFSVTSDDGSILKIGTQSVVLNDGLHGMVEKGGVIGLLPGKHSFTVDFFEAGGGAGCIVQLSGPGMAKAPIPPSRFTRGGTSNRYDINGSGTVDGADLGILLGLFGTSSANADFNNDGQVDGADLGALLGAWGS